MRSGDRVPAVLVTGGAGFIGSNLVRYLRRERP
ncbi:MAG TPA: NAD-dependent epimerase/dehydratase family protein, partial [Myxococcales bacterium]|nr:NAD-dependent epimerase/dehydratase family protein [Myxococcales bacterium]